MITFSWSTIVHSVGIKKKRSSLCNYLSLALCQSPLLVPRRRPTSRVLGCNSSLFLKPAVGVCVQTGGTVSPPSSRRIYITRKHMVPKGNLELKSKLSTAPFDTFPFGFFASVVVIATQSFPLPRPALCCPRPQLHSYRYVHAVRAWPLRASPELPSRHP